MWAAVSETKNPKTLGKFIDDLVKECVKEMEKQGLARSSQVGPAYFFFSAFVG